MQISCSNCDVTSGVILSEYKFSCSDMENVPVYQCKICGSYYIKMFSHGIKVVMQNGRLVPVGDLIINMFAENDRYME